MSRLLAAIRPVHVIFVRTNRLSDFYEMCMPICKRLIKFFFQKSNFLYKSMLKYGYLPGKTSLATFKIKIGQGLLPYRDDSVTRESKMPLPPKRGRNGQTFNQRMCSIVIARRSGQY